MGAIQFFGESDVAIVVVTGRTNGDKKLQKGRSISYQRYSSTLFSLHRDVVCDGPRQSSVLKSLFALSAQKARLEIDMEEEEAKAFPQLIDYIYNGTPLKEGDTALANLARRLDAYPSEDSERSTSSSSIQDDVADRDRGVAATSRPSRRASFPPPTRMEMPQPNPHLLREMEGATNRQPRKHPKNQRPTKLSKGLRSRSSSPSSRASSSVPVHLRSSSPLSRASSLMPVKKDQSLAHMLASFRGIPNLLRGMQSSNDSETKRQSQKSLETLLKVAANKRREVLVASIVYSTGSIPYLLEILSGDQYTTLHLAAVNMLDIVAKDSEYHASRLGKALVVEKMLECQLVHGLEIRSRALGVIASIGMHSEKLCGQVLSKTGCLKAVVIACEKKETGDNVVLLLCQFCRLFPKQVLRKNVVETVSKYINGLSDQDIFEAATSSYVSLANATPSTSKENMYFDGILSLGLLISEAARSSRESASRGKRALWVLTHLINKPFILRPFLIFGRGKTNMAGLLRAPCKDAQLLACTLVAAFANSLRKNREVCAVANSRHEIEEEQKIEDWCNTDLIPPLVKLIARDETARVSAAMASAELIRYSDSTAHAFVLANGIPPLCDALNCAESNQDLKVNVLLGLQRLLEINDGTVASDIQHSIGTNLARAMLGRSLLAD